MSDLRAAWEKLCARVERAAVKAGRQAGAIAILPVSKGQDAGLLGEALGLPNFPRRFGENYLEELEAKYPQFPANVEWHYQGRLQSRKIGRVAELATVVQTVARDKELRLLAACARVPELYLQVNVSAEGQKNGCSVDELPMLLALTDELGIRARVRGLMCLPSDLDHVDERKLRAEFGRLRELRDRHLPGGRLSMGMSQDFEIAIEEGSDLVRVGSLLFGERKAP